MAFSAGKSIAPSPKPHLVSEAKVLAGWKDEWEFTVDERYIANELYPNPRSLKLSARMTCQNGGFRLTVLMMIEISSHPIEWTILNRIITLKQVATAAMAGNTTAMAMTY